MTTHRTRWAVLLMALLAAATMATAASAAPPVNTSTPTIEGNAETPFVGDKLTANPGQWSGSPTGYKYQWDRCNALGDRVNCVAVTGATSAAYTVEKADVGHTLRVRVTATNADGSATKDSRATGIVSDTVAPKVYARPVLSGTAEVGSSLTTTIGTWAGASTFKFQWQQCDKGGNNCSNVAGATGRTYGVRSSDVGMELRAVVTATNKYGSTNASSNFSDIVTAAGGSTTTVVTTVAGNRAPTLTFISLTVRSNRVYVRFRVCDDSHGRITLTARDQMARRLAYTRRFAVSPYSCGTYARNWPLIQRFRGHGRFVVSLRASDASGRLSRLVSRSVVR